MLAYVSFKQTSMAAAVSIVMHERAVLIVGRELFCAEYFIKNVNFHCHARLTLLSILNEASLVVVEFKWIIAENTIIDPTISLNQTFN